MKTQKPSHNRLVIILPQYALRFIGFMFIVIGGVMFGFMSATNHLQCQCQSAEQPDNCQLTTRYLFFYKHRQSLGRIQQAQLAIHKGRSKKSIYNVSLRSTQGRVLLNAMDSSNENKCQQIVRRINAYLKTCDAGGLPIPSIHSFWLQLFVVIFPISGILMLIFTSRITLDFNKDRNQFKIRRQTFFTRSEERYNLNEIMEVIIESSQGQKGQKNYRVALILKNGETIPLTTAYDSLLSSKVKLMQTLVQFLNLKNNLPFWQQALKKQTNLAHFAFGVGAIIITIIVLIAFFS